LEELVLLLEVRNLLCLVILRAERRWRTQELLATGGHAIGTGVVGVVGLRLIVDGERLLARPIDPLREVDVHILLAAQGLGIINDIRDVHVLELIL
jgi:hypothetical protein